MSAAGSNEALWLLTGGAAFAAGVLHAIAALGGLIGAGLLLVTPAQVFSGLVPWLLHWRARLFGPKRSG
ncbi:hypothetical protein [Limnohabitans sp.]|uniref:hypothetical protein n=1 Tax=Limnohabitans sp. TaxID=1907725 RepID=UPI0039BD4EF6|nr:hypothetical protein [Comamonadaceae bacterium]